MKWRAAIVVLAIAAVSFPLPTRVVQAIYAGRVFPVLQALVTTTSNRVSFALFDVLIGLAACWWLIFFVRDLHARTRTGVFRAILRIAVRTATLTSASYLVFLLLWGLNYRRVPLMETLQYDASRASTEAAVRLAGTTVERVNALYEAAHREESRSGDVDPALADAFAAARQELGLSVRTVPARPKVTLLDLYFRRAGVSGMTDPYFLETLVATDLLPFERPFVVAHEWSHLAGIADEGDANFAGWLTCLRGTSAHQYSGWLFLYGEVVGSLDRTEARTIAAALADGPRSDLQAIRDRLSRQMNPTVSAAGWRVYDRYLKANNVERGAASYAEVVRLILGTQFSEDWVPARRR